MRDVVVVGGGPAGLTVARFCATHGLDVVVLERKPSFGSVVRCGEYLASNAEIKRMFPRAYELEDLHESVRGCVERKFDAFAIHSPRGKRYVVPFEGLTIDRPKFERNLAGTAQDAGAEILLDTRVKTARGHDVSTTRGVVEGTVVVAADGPSSLVSRAAGIPRPAQLYKAVATHVKGSFPEKTTMYFGHLSPGAYAWIFPKDGHTNAGLGVWDRFKGNLSELLKSWLRKMNLECGSVHGKLVPASGPISPVQRDNVLAVGDAAGQVIPTTGGGIQTSMICAREAAKAIVAHISEGEPLSRYEVASRGIVWDRLRMGVRIKNLADKVFWSDAATGAAMRVLGTEGIGRVLRCQRLFLSEKAPDVG